MKRQLLTALMTAGAAILLLGGCGKEKETPVAESTVTEVYSSGYKVGISFPNATDGRWKYDGEKLTALFKEKGVEVILSYAGGQTATQASDIVSMVSGGCDLLVVAPVEGADLDSSLQKAKEAGIPVISYDDLIMNTDAVTAYITFSDYEAGKLEAKYIANKLGLKESENNKEHGIEFAACTVADDPVGYIFNGAFDVMKPFFDNDGLRSISGENTLRDSLKKASPEPVPAETQDKKTAEAKARTAAENKVVSDQTKRLGSIISSNYTGEYELSAILCTDPLSARAAEKALENELSKNHSVIITACGTDEDLLEKIVDKKIDMTVFEPTDELYRILIPLSISLMSGESSDQYLIERSGLTGVTYDTESYDNGRGVVASYLLSPVAVTASTLDGELIKTGYYTMNGKYPRSAR